jgi:type I restriction enzyme M protein
MSQRISENSNSFLVYFTKLEGRFDPAFYQPIFSEILGSGEMWQKLGDIALSIHHPPEYERDYSDSGIQLIRSQNIRPTGLSLDENPVYFSKTFLDDKKVVFPEIGDVLIVRSGVNAGDVAVIEKKINNAIIGADNLLLKPNDRVVPKFVQVFFFTNIGRSLLNRYLTGATNKHISPYYLADVPIPLISFEDQKTCIEIFEKGLASKIQKETEAQQLLKSIDAYLLGELGIELPGAENEGLEARIFLRNFRDTRGRLDPFFYRTEFVQIESQISDCSWDVVSLDSIFQINRGGSPRPINSYFTEADDGLNWIKIGDTKNDDKYIYRTNQKIKPEGAKYSRKVEPGDFILSNSMSFGRPYIVKISGYIHDGWLLFKPKTTDVNHDYLHSVLSSRLIYRLFKKATIGGVVENLNIALVKKVRIPLPPIDKQVEIANQIAAIKSQAKLLQQQAQTELLQAKQAIEAMILGE